MKISDTPPFFKTIPHFTNLSLFMGTSEPPLLFFKNFENLNHPTIKRVPAMGFQLSKTRYFRLFLLPKIDKGVSRTLSNILRTTFDMVLRTLLVEI